MRFGCALCRGVVIPVASVRGGLVNLQRIADLVAGGFQFPVGTTLIHRLMSPDPKIATVFEVLESMKSSPASKFSLPAGPVKWLSPVPDARQIICVGLNYRSHCAEQRVKPPTEPRYFAKLVSSMTGHLEPVSLWPISNRIDYEGELAVVIGRRTFRAGRQDALSHVAGYTVVNDVSARDLQESDRQWTRAKSLDGFCPTGPFLTTADEIPDPGNLRIVTTVNGEVRQDCSTSDMLFPVDELVSIVSQAITLEAGDIIATGTPAGVGKFRDPPEFLKDGDEVSITVGGLGTLTNRFRIENP